MWLVVLVGVIIVVAVVVVISMQGGTRSRQTGYTSARNTHRTPSTTRTQWSSDEAGSGNLQHDSDGTPYGAIEDVLMDADGDGEWDDFDGDGMPDW